MSTLGMLPDVTRLTDRVIRVMGGNPGKFTLQGTNTYLVGTGPKRILIDTGEGKTHWFTSLKKILTDEKAEVSTALITHWHHDHVNGIPDLRFLFPNIKVYKNNADAGQDEIRDGQIFSVEGATLTAYHTPGHTRDHMCFYLHEEKALFTGDNVLGHGTSVFENLRIYVESLRRMKSIPGMEKIGYPGHGAMIADIKSTIERYITHRLARTKQIIDVLKGAGAEAITSLEIVKKIYRNEIPESLYPAAEHGVIQILEILEEEKGVVRQRGKWVLASETW